HILKAKTCATAAALSRALPASRCFHLYRMNLLPPGFLRRLLEGVTDFVAFFMDRGNSETGCHAKSHQRRLRELQAGFDGFRHGVSRAETVQMPRMTFVPGARHDENIGPCGADMLNDLIDDACGVDGDDDTAGGGKSAGFQKTRISRIAIEDVVAFAAITRDGGGVRVGDNVGNAVLAQERAHNLADPAVANHDGMPLPAGGTYDNFGIDSLGGRQPRRELPRGNG